MSIKSIVTNINELKKPCLEITKEDDIKSIIQDLKDTLEFKKGLGLSANQIGIQKKISYNKIPNKINKDKTIEYYELVLINAKIIEKSNPIKINNESCLSFPGLAIITKRYVFITIQYLDENFKEQTLLAQDLQSLVIQHEIDHINGKTLFDRKWRAK
jgi:peptide deformylase